MFWGREAIVEMEKSCVQTYNQASILARCCILEKYIVIEYEQIDGIDVVQEEK